MDEKPRYLIGIRRSGSLRPAKESEVRGIDAHRADYPKCNGTQVQDDDQTLWGHLICGAGAAGNAWALWKSRPALPKAVLPNSVLFAG
jgi:hypothetical protein